MDCSAPRRPAGLRVCGGGSSPVSRHGSEDRIIGQGLGQAVPSPIPKAMITTAAPCCPGRCKVSVRDRLADPLQIAGTAGDDRLHDQLRFVVTVLTGEELFDARHVCDCGFEGEEVLGVVVGLSLPLVETAWKIA